MEDLKIKADQEAFQHTVFMALADIYNRLNPSVEVGEYLMQLQANKEAEKNRIINSFIRNEKQ